MVNFISAKTLEYADKLIEPGPAGHRLDLLVVMILDEALDRRDGRVGGARPENSRPGTEQPPGQIPDRQQVAFAFRRQKTLEETEMPHLREKVAASETREAGVARNEEHAAVDRYRAVLARVIGAQVSSVTCRQRQRVVIWNVMLLHARNVL